MPPLFRLQIPPEHPDSGGDNRLTQGDNEAHNGDNQRDLPFVDFVPILGNGWVVDSEGCEFIRDLAARGDGAPGNLAGSGSSGVFVCVGDATQCAVDRLDMGSWRGF